ncbi:MAG: serine hydrolase [Pirellulales bacterium]|nr:serine hydrolase [Pirellulales bacterium]
MRISVGMLLLPALAVPVAANWYESNPIYTDPADGTGPWVRGTPPSQGMNAVTLSRGVGRLKADRRTLGVIVIRNGVIVHESYYRGATQASASNVHSASKSIVAALACRAVEDGLIESLDTPICKVIPQYFAKYPSDDPRRRITVKHLMTMTSGLDWAEDDTEYEIGDSPGWVQAVLDRGMATADEENTPVAPGEVFNYSTGNTHLLSAVLHKVTGLTTAEYARRTILDGIGAEAEHWGADPEGISSGGCNVYLTARELAAFGLLYLNDGKSRNGAQVLPTWAVTASLVDYGHDYGLCWWTDVLAGQRVWQAWGWGGQVVYVIPSLKIVFVMTTNTARDGTETEPAIHEIFVRDYLIPSVTVRPKGRDRRPGLRQSKRKSQSVNRASGGKRGTREHSGHSGDTSRY